MTLTLQAMLEASLNPDVVDLAAVRRDYLESPAGKARSAIARAARIAELNSYIELHRELACLETALNRGDGGQGRAVARVVYAVGRVPDGPARGALTALAVEIAEHVRGTL